MKRIAMSAMAGLALVLPLTACSGGEGDLATFCDKGQTAYAGLDRLDLDDVEAYRSGLVALAAEFKDVKAPRDIADDWKVIDGTVQELNRAVGAAEPDEAGVAAALEDVMGGLDGDRVLEAESNIRDFFSDRCD